MVAEFVDPISVDRSSSRPTQCRYNALSDTVDEESKECVALRSSMIGSTSARKSTLKLLVSLFISTYLFEKGHKLYQETLEAVKQRYIFTKHNFVETLLQQHRTEVYLLRMERKVGS